MHGSSIYSTTVLSFLLSNDVLVDIFPLKVMKDEWEKYLLSKVELKGYQSRVKGAKKKPNEPKGFGILNGVAPTTSKENAEPSSINKQENDALLAAAAEIRSLSKKEAVTEDPCPHHVGDEVDAKVKTTGKSKRPSRKRQNSETHNETGCKCKTSNISRASNPSKEGEKADNDTIIGDGLLGGEEGTLLAGNEVLRKHNQEITPGYIGNGKRLPPVHFHALESDHCILDTLKPSVIIVYHPDITFVREIEVYNAENPSRKVKVYFLFYEDSTEVQKFESSIRRENGAFESLIRQKSMMMIPVDLVFSFTLSAVRI